MLALLFLITGCSLSSAPHSQVSQTFATENSILLQADANATVTLTPFQPIPITATSAPTFTPTATNTPTPIPTPTIGNSVYLGLARPEGQINVLLLGSDYRSGSGFRTDTILVLSLNPKKGTAVLMSFPRDLYVDIPGVGMSRINAAQSNGGFPLMAATMKKNFDIDIDYYLLTNFSGFKNIINSLNGISVYAARDFRDKCDLPQAVDKYCTISQGYNDMDGATALWYVRSRYSTSDFDRTRRTQEVILAIFKKAMSLDAVNHGSELYEQFRNSVETNLPPDKVLQLLPFASTLMANPGILRQYSIGANEVSNYYTENGAEVLLPDWYAVTPLIKQAFYQ